MIRLPSLPSGFVVFCDDIRQEINGKISLIGVYANEIIVFADAPTVFPKLAVLVVVRFPEDKVPERYKLKIVFAPHSKATEDIELLDVDASYTGESAAPAPAVDAGPDTFRFGEIRHIVTLNAIPFPETGHVKVRIIDGDDEIRLGVVDVRFQPVPDETVGAQSFN